MNKIAAKFEKISYEQFKKDCDNLSLVCNEELYNSIELPRRGTSRSAGYDINTPFSFTLEPLQTITIPTGIRIILPEEYALFIIPRSGIGFKTNIRLSNTIGLIDSDYYFADNEGHIMVKLTSKDKSYHYIKNERFVQGIILPFFVTEDDCPLQIARSGGFGSTGKI